MSQTKLSAYQDPDVLFSDDLNSTTGLFVTNYFTDGKINNNLTHNEHTHPGEDYWRMNTMTIIGLSFLFFFIVTVGIFGNVMVIVVIFCDFKMRRTVTNMLITNLAIADLIIMVLGVPEIAMFMINRGWILGPHACKGNRFILVAALYSSVLSLLVLCCERFIAIVFPFKISKICTRQTTILTIVAIWMTAICGALPVVLHNQLVPPGSPVQHCQLFLPGKNPMKSFIIYKYVEAVIFYFIPMLIQIVLYSVIAKRLFASNEQLRAGFQMCTTNRITRNDANGGSSSITATTAPPISRANDRTDAIKARRGVVKMLVSSVVLYFISYSPIQFRLIYNTFSYSDVLASREFFIFVMIITHINSAANPVLYGIFSQNFRRHFKRCLRSGLLCRHDTVGRESSHSRIVYSSRSSRMTSMRGAAINGKVLVSRL